MLQGNSWLPRWGWLGNEYMCILPSMASRSVRKVLRLALSSDLCTANETKQVRGRVNQAKAKYIL